MTHVKTLQDQIGELRQHSGVVLQAGMLREHAIADALAEFADLVDEFNDGGWDNEQRESAMANLRIIETHTGMSGPRIVDTCQRIELLVSIYAALIRTYPEA